MPERSIYDIQVKTVDGAVQSLADFRGHTLLVVNVASQCGFTPQYAGLEALYRKYQDRGLVVLGFPCNQFGTQEPGTEQEIRQFCSSTYDVTFPLFSKIEVNGPNAHPLYELLKAARPGFLGSKKIKWNFTKFLVTADGTVVARYAPSDTPEHIDAAVGRVVASAPPPPQASPKERRQHARMDRYFDCTYTTAWGSAEGRVNSLSSNGCYIESRTAALEPGTNLEEITIALPTESLVLRGQVLNPTRGVGFAVQFHDVGPAALKTLAALKD